MISKYISLEEATHTGTGLPNIPTADQLEAMQHVAQNVFDRVRESFNCAIGVNSFFRSYEVNKTVGGAALSQHTSGEAIDIDGKKYNGPANSKIFHYIKDNLDFDQLIWEFGNEHEPSWVHVSLKKGMNRRMILKAVKQNGRTVYIPYR